MFGREGSWNSQRTNTSIKLQWHLITALSIFMVVAGILMAVFPAKALAVFGYVWPAGRTVTPSAAPKVMACAEALRRVLRCPRVYVLLPLSVRPMTRARIAGASLLVLLAAGLLIRITNRPRVTAEESVSAPLEIRTIDGQPVTETVDLRNGNLRVEIPIRAARQKMAAPLSRH